MLKIIAVIVLTVMLSSCAGLKCAGDIGSDHPVGRC